MPDTLLHWHCSGKTYSVKRITADTAYLLITGPDGQTRRSRRPLALSLVEAWARLPINERCEHAEGEVERRLKPREDGHPAGSEP